MGEYRFGAFDPIYPNGLVSIANGEHIFGLRLLTRDNASGKIAAGRSLDFFGLAIGPIDADRYFKVKWTHEGKSVRLIWGRIDEKSVWGEVSMDEGLTVALEMYVPREYRLSKSWVNFTRQSEHVMTGEMISPYPQAKENAVRLTVSDAPSSCEGYNLRDEALIHFEKTGVLANVAPGNIWCDMGVSWYQGLTYERAFFFHYSVGDPQSFLALPDEQTRNKMFMEGRETVMEAKRRFLNTRLTGQGALAGIPDAMESPIRFNTMYREDTRHRFIMVDRPWARSDDDWGITFNWDTFLSSMAASWFDIELAMENIRCGFDMQMPDGRIPLHARVQQGHRAEPPILAGRAQHIVQGLTVWETYLWSRDKRWLAECYEGVKRAHDWWLSDRGDGQRWRDAKGWGLIGFGYDPELEMGVLGARIQPYVGKAQYAYFETYDDSPQWTDGIYFKTVRGMRDVKEVDVTDRAKYLEGKNTVNMYTLERCCLYAVDAECLAQMAAELGYVQDEARYRAEYDAMKARVNEKMWDEADGCYYNLHFDGHFSKVQTPDCFMPVMAGIAPPERAERLMKLMTDEAKFWGEYKMPSVSRDDPSYADQKYWRGQIWPPQVLWTHLSLRRLGKRAESWALAESSSAMLRREWQENGYYPENYNGDTGRCSGSPHYNWGTLMGLIALREMVQLTPDAAVFGDTAAPDGTKLFNIPLDGHRWDVEITEGRVRVSRDGVRIADQVGPVKILRNG